MAIQILPYIPKNTPPEIIQYPDKRLRETCKKVTNFDQELEKIAHDLISVLKKVDIPFMPWYGMAANQIGYDKRVIAIKRSYHKYTIMVNPEIIEKKWNIYSISSCFSLKGMYLLKRQFWQKVRYQDLKGNHHEDIFKGGYSTVLQQEIDHIDGKLVCD